MSSRKTKTSTVTQATVSRRKVSTALSLERLEDRQYRSGTPQEIGINVNDSSAAGVVKAVPILKELGVTTVRLWAGVKDFTSHTMIAGLQRAIDYHNAGFDVTLTVANSNTLVPDPAAVKGWFDWAMSNATLKKAVGRWEIGNEVDQSMYFKGTLKQYVDDFLTPAYQSLHAAGETVVSAGVSWNPQDVQTMIGDGLLNVCDDIGFHPYANGVATQEQHIEQLNAIVAGRKPLIATEWNVRGYENNKTAWAASVEQAYANVHSGFDLDYYYCLWAVPTPAGPGGLVTESNLQVNQPFWDSFTTATDNYAESHNGATTPTQTPTPTDGSSDSGNTAAGIGASISGILYGDSNKDGTLDSGEPVAANRIVYIDENGNGKLDAGEVSTTTNSKGQYMFSDLKARTYKISRVFPDGYMISNSSRTYITATVAANQQMSHVNIGSMLIPTTETGSGSTSSGSTSGSSSSGSASTTATASISGTLFGDSNDNGVLDSGEPHAIGRLVFIDSNGNGVLDSGEASTKTDSKGHYTFSNLKPGSYKISRVFPDGYTMSHNGSMDIVASITAGQALTNLNIGSTPITKTTSSTSTSSNSSSSELGSISGVIFGDSNANGVYDSGEDTGADRTVFIDTNGNGKLDAGEVSTTTDAKGRYTFDDLEAGSYKISRVYPDAYKMSNNTGKDISVTVAAGQDRTSMNIGSVRTNVTLRAA